MINEIDRQIDAINSTLRWIKAHKPNYYEQKFMQLVSERCILRTIRAACHENPAVAAYGESQKGKSYLIGNLLQDNGAPFLVKDSDGSEIDFVKSINPIGRKQEATGVVTRFSAFKGASEARHSAEHPVLMKLFSVSDIVTILCDGYFNDISDYETYSDEQMKDFAEEVYSTYKDRDVIAGSPIVEDDILTIKNYLSKHVKAKSQNLWKSPYFDRLSLVITRIPRSDWSNVFSVLWYRNVRLTSLFDRLVNVIGKLKYEKEVYLNMDAVMHHGYNKNTIMSVECLSGLDKDGAASVADVFIKKSDGSFEVVRGLSKSELSAICAETVFKVDKRYTQSQIRYDMEMIPEETRSRLASGPLKNTLMNYTDLLDFPGARNRLCVKAEHLDAQFADDRADEGTSNLVQILLRGKVAYLFNKYCDDKIINVLLFCQDNENVNVTSMYATLENWVKNYVGNDSESRRQTMAATGGIAPLFLIATKFNIDMALEGYSEHNSRAALDQRWEGRFRNILYTQSLKAADADWFKNWSGRSESFKNCYLLRDFKYSNCSGNGNNLYSGFTEDNPREESLNLPVDFYNTLRTSFIESQAVQTFFPDPAVAWDASATIRNDGSVLIIEKLSAVAEKVEVTRNEQFAKVMAETKSRILQIIDEYHEPDDKTDLLQRNIKKARKINGELDFTCNRDNYYFGHLVQTLQVSFKTVYNIVYKTIQDPTLIQQVASFSNYEIIMKRCGERLRQCHKVEDVLSVIMDEYGYDSLDETRNRLASHGVNPEDLVDMQYRKKLNSGIIAENVYDAWKSRLRSSELLSGLSDDDNVDNIIISSLVDGMISSAEDLRLHERMAEEISEYVDVLNIHTANVELVADILRSMINEFVTDFGYSMRDEEQIDRCREISDANSMDLFRYIDDFHPEEPMDEETLSAFFNDITRNPSALTPSFEENYYKWTKYMFIAFIAETGIAKGFDAKANAELTSIIENLG